MAVSLSPLVLTASPEAAVGGRRRWSPKAAAKEVAGIRVCVNRSCARQGARETLAALSGLAPPGVAVASCGCLGRCGAGPNLAVLPGGVLVGHCGTAARAARLLADLLGPAAFDPERNLEAFALRRKGESELEEGNAAQAEGLLTQAIDLEPCGGRQFLYKSRSAARLAMGNNPGALQDGKEASRISSNYAQAHICQGDAFFAMEQWDAAEKAYSTALLCDPSIRRSKSFKARISKLQEKFIPSNT